MASSIIGACDVSTGVSTALIILPLYTTLLGVLLIVTGRLKLASIVQYLPMPVIGGYLAFIGFFCGQAGLAMMAGVDVSGPADWWRLCNTGSVVLFLPGLVLGCAIYLVLITFRSPLVLPVCLVASLLGFYTVLWLSGQSLQDARDAGWIGQLQPTGNE
jgi:SulP family sulfate permease